MYNLRGKAMKKTLCSIIAFFITFAIVAKQTEGANLSIEYYERTMYYPGNPDTNPVKVKVTISNNGTETLRFKLADDRKFSMDFNAYTVKNTKIKDTPNLIQKRTTNQRVYFREISLESGEEYSFTENVKDFLDIAEPAMYYLELNFYPELYRNQDEVLTSNRLNLEIRPSPSAASSIKIPIDAKTATILKPEEIPPDRVVDQTIIARQKQLWDQFFLYLDIEQMYKSNSINARQYQQGSASDRTRMLEQYKADLKQQRIDRDIVRIPCKYTIEKTVYTANEGTVTVLEWFDYDTYKEKKRYTYSVRQHDGIWQIYAYSVDNLGTE